MVRNCPAQGLYLPENLFIVHPCAVADIEQSLPILRNPVIFCIQDMILHGISDFLEILLHLVSHGQHAFHILHYEEIRPDPLHGFHIAFVQVVPGVVNQPLPVGHAEPLAGRPSHHNMDLLPADQFLQSFHHILDIPQYNVIPGCLWMIMGIGIHTAFLNVIGQGRHKAFLGKAQGKPPGPAEEIHHLQGICADLPSDLQDIGVTILRHRAFPAFPGLFIADGRKPPYSFPKGLPFLCQESFPPPVKELLPCFDCKPLPADLSIFCTCFPLLHGGIHKSNELRFIVVEIHNDTTQPLLFRSYCFHGTGSPGSVPLQVPLLLSFCLLLYRHFTRV